MLQIILTARFEQDKWSCAMLQVMPQHEFLKETARKSQPLLSMLAEKKIIHFPLFQKKGGKKGNLASTQ